MKYLICSSNTAGYLNSDITFSTKETDKTISFDSLKEALEYLQSNKFFFCYPVLIQEDKKPVPAKKTGAKKSAKKVKRK